MLFLEHVDEWYYVPDYSWWDSSDMRLNDWEFHWQIETSSWIHLPCLTSLQARESKALKWTTSVWNLCSLCKLMLMVMARSDFLELYIINLSLKCENGGFLKFFVNKITRRSCIMFSWVINSSCIISYLPFPKSLQRSPCGRSTHFWLVCK